MGTDRSWVVLRTFSESDRKLQGTPGAIAVLHTHSRQLNFHPHVHLVMPAVAIDTKHRLLRRKSKGKTNKDYLFNHKALAKVFRAKILNGLTNACITLPENYPAKWVVDCKHVGSGEKALTYLARYLYKGVILEKDIVACNNGEVTFRYKDSRSGQTRFRSLTGVRFLYLLLRHALPKGFRRARHYGFFHHNSKRLIQLLQLILKFYPSNVLRNTKPRPQLKCTVCGAVMKIVKTRLQPRQIDSLMPT